MKVLGQRGEGNLALASLLRHFCFIEMGADSWMLTMAILFEVAPKGAARVCAVPNRRDSPRASCLQATERELVSDLCHVLACCSCYPSMRSGDNIAMPLSGNTIGM